METIEQMLERQVQKTANDTRIIEYSDAEAMMSEYAKQQIIAFTEWSLKSAAREGANKWFYGGVLNHKIITTEQLYDIFLLTLIQPA